MTDQLDENSETLRYRGYRTDNNQLVIIRMLNTKLINPQLVARLHDEYQLNRQLIHPGIIQVYSLQPHDNTSEVKQQDWRNKLLAALAPNAQLIIEIVPALEKLIGKQPSVPIVEATAAQIRFNWTWLSFIQVFCQSYPLVIFLDDWQWANVATLELIELILSAEEIKNLFLVGAYQEDEVNHNHPLVKMLNRLPKTIRVNHLSLTPLTGDS